MAENWLAALGSRLVAPIKAILHPWWDRLVEQKAESSAVRVKLLEAIVRFRVRDYQQHQSMDPDRASGLATKIIERLKPTVKENAAIDLCAEEFVGVVQQEIELHGVPLTAWVELACLAESAVNNHQKAIVVEFTDAKGNQSHGSTVVFSLQSSFPFTKIWNMTGLGVAGLSAEAVALLKEYCTRNTLPEARYEIADAVPMMMTWGLSNPRVLPPAWKPK